MKVALILPAELKMAPYVQYYTQILDNIGCDYKIIVWNRSGQAQPEHSKLIIYQRKSPETLNGFYKLIDYYMFTKFVKKELKREKYDYLILYTIIPVVFIREFLKKYYTGRYIVDIRDICSQYGVMKFGLKKALDYSMLNVVSSPGFKKWLPKNDYIVSHNIGHKWEKKIEIEKRISFNECITILTIGFIRYFDVNKCLIDYFANNRKFKLLFAGKGEAGIKLKEYSKNNHIENVIFSGEYIKSDEDSIVEKADFISILLPKESVIPQAIANRFYLAILNCKPLIVNKGGIQAEYVDKYGLGISIGDNDNLVDAIEYYQSHFDEKRYLKNRKAFLKEIQYEVELFESSICKYIKG